MNRTLKIYQGKLGYESWIADITIDDGFYIPHKGDLINIGDDNDSTVYQVRYTMFDYADYSDNVMPQMEPLIKFYDNLLFKAEHRLLNRELIVPEYVGEIKTSLRQSEIEPKGPKL